MPGAAKAPAQAEQVDAVVAAEKKGEIKAGEQSPIADKAGAKSDKTRDQRKAETKEAIKKKDATLATGRADKLKDVLQESGKKLYAEAAARTTQARPNVQEPTGEPRPSGSGPRGKVVDAEFHETKQP